MSNPVKLSVLAMKMSSTPRFLRLLSTVSQNLALSFSPTQRPKTSFRPSRSIPMAIYNNLSFAAHVVVDGVQKHHRIDALQGPLLPFLRNGQKLIRDPAHRRIGDFYAVDVPNVCLNISCSHSFGVHRQYLFLYVLADAGLIFLQQLRFEFSISVSGNRYVHRPKAGT